MMTLALCTLCEAVVLRDGVCKYGGQNLQYFLKLYIIEKKKVAIV